MKRILTLSFFIFIFGMMLADIGPARTLDFDDSVISRVVERAPFFRQTLDAYLYRLEIESDPLPTLRELARRLHRFLPEESETEILAHLKRKYGLQEKSLFARKHLSRVSRVQNSSGFLVGSPQRINDSDNNCWQVDMAISEVSGLILAVWEDERNDAESHDIYGQFCNLSLYEFGTDFRIPSDRSGASQANPSVAATSNGGFIVVWEDYRDGNSAIYGRLFDENREPLGDDFLIHGDVRYSLLAPQVAADSRGFFTVVWLANENYDFNVYARRLANSGEAVGDAFLINSDEGGFQWFPDIATAPTGESLIVWEDKRNDNSDIFCQALRDDGGKRGGNIRVDDSQGTTRQWRPFVAAADGHFIVTWEDERDTPNAIYAQWFDEYVLKDGENVRIDDRNEEGIKEWPAVALNDGGESLFCWQDTRNDNYDLFAKRFSLEKTEQGMIQLTEAIAGSDQTLGRVGVAGASAIFFWLDKNPEEDWQNVFADLYDWSSLPVELVSFSAEVSGKTVFLRWTTASESNNFGFSLQRKREGEEFAEIAFIRGRGTSNRPSAYSYSDQVPRGTYFYRLKQIDNDGKAAVSQSLRVKVEAPETFALSQNYPNPFNAGTLIEFDLPTKAWIELMVFDLQGQPVRVLVHSQKEEGHHKVYWDGLDDQGKSVASGVYFYRLKSGHLSQVNKLVLTK